jgi:hypothetical protein
MSRPIGIGIRLVCEAVSWMGPSGSKAVAAWTGLSRCDVSRYAGRAEKHGLLQISRDGRRHVYVAVSGWERMVDGLPKQEKPQRLPANSVFQMGDMAGAQA